MHKDVEPFLNDTTKFWIVKPILGINKVQGLEALITGPYIQMYAKAKKFTKTKFKGLEEPPIDSSILNGKIIKLISSTSYGLKEKMPVFYKDMEVGSIIKKELKDNKVIFYISIKKEYEKYVNNTTKFWNIRGLDISLDKDNIKFQIPPLSEIFVGGIAFDTLEFDKNLTKNEFILYSSKSDAYENKLGEDKSYIDVFLKIKNYKNSLLKVGDSVYFKGFKVGYINYLSSKLDDDFNIITNCYLKIDVNAFNGFEGIKKAIKNGLKATILVNNPILNNAKIELFFKGKGEVKKYNNMLIIPIVKVYKEGVMDTLNEILTKINKIDFEKISSNLNKFIVDADKSVVELSKTLNKVSIDASNILESNETKNLAKNINKTLNNLQKLSNTYNKNSMFYIKLNEILKNINNSILLFQKIEKKIDNKPNSLIFGD